MLVAYTVHGLALEALVDEVGCFFVPTIWNVIVSDLNLATENLISNVFSRAALVGPLTHHALVGDDTDSKIVCSQPVVLSTHDLGGHVSWRATCLTCVIGGQNPSNTEIGQAQIALIVKYKILWLDISMNNKLGMNSIKCVNKACNEETGNFHGELAFTCDMVPQISSQKQIHHQVQVQCILEGIVHVHNELALNH